MRFFSIVLEFFPSHFQGSVLDIGSLDINGGPHSLLSSREYIGVDLGEGKNVDVVARGETLAFESGRFDVAMSSECFEHNPAWRATLNNMVRMIRPGGLVVFTCATTGRSEHGTSRSGDSGYSAPLAVAVGQEHYRNVTPRQVRAALAGDTLHESFTVVNKASADLLFAGIRGPASDTDLDSLRHCEGAVREALEVGKYPGKFSRHVAITLMGDRGARLYGQVARTLTSEGRAEDTTGGSPL
jgi:SAM-dependent methyltransferase